MVKVIFTKHAEDMLLERNCSRDMIKSVIDNPNWKEDKEDELWHAFKKYQNKVLRVVVKGRKDPYTVITMFYDRRLRSHK